MQSYKMKVNVARNSIMLNDDFDASIMCPRNYGILLGYYENEHPLECICIDNSKSESPGDVIHVFPVGLFKCRDKSTNEMTTVFLVMKSNAYIDIEANYFSLGTIEQFLSKLYVVGAKIASGQSAHTVLKFFKEEK